MTITHKGLTEQLLVEREDATKLRERNAKLVAALDHIAAMDSLGKRADDLGRAARIAHAALANQQSTEKP